MSAFVFRRADGDDLERIGEVDAFVVTHPGAKQRLLKALDAGEVLVALDGERIVAFMALEYGFYDHAFVAFLAVDEAHRRRGIASKLLRASEERARKGKVFASTTASNATMQAVFEHNGWVRSGFFSGLNDDLGSVDEVEVLYYKALAQ